LIRRDDCQRLVYILHPNSRTTTYGYDQAGNRSNELINESNVTTENIYHYNEQNRLTDISRKVNNVLIETTVYAYDNNGNQLTTVVNTYQDGAFTSSVTASDNTYDVFNQLIKTVSEDGTVVNNIYNAEGYRTGKELDGEQTYYLYEADKVILEVDDNEEQKSRNVYGTNLLMREVAGDTYYYLYNGHADVTTLITAEGNIAATYYYDAFGNILESTGDVNNSILYCGYQYDKETDLYYLNARMYDPKIARFMQEDTYSGDPSDPLSLNLYAYCFNSPIIYYDPSGHFWTKAYVGSTLQDVWVNSGEYRHYYDGSTLRAEWVPNKYAPINEDGSSTDDFWLNPSFFSDKWYWDKDKVVTTLERLKDYLSVSGNSIDLRIANPNILKTLQWAINNNAKGEINGNDVSRFEAIGTLYDLPIFDISNFNLSYIQGIENYYYKHVYTDKRTGQEREAMASFAEDFYTAAIGVSMYYQQTSINKSEDTYEAKELDVEAGNQQLPQKGGLNSSVTEINPNDIRFSQSSVNGADEIITSMKNNGWQGDAIDVVRMSDCKLTTLDNTRVLSARYADINVQANIHTFDEVLPTNLIERFTTPKGIPSTWGEAVSLRIGKQNSIYRNMFPTGSNIIGWSGN
jgi:RHS repeat-associated protein